MARPTSAFFVATLVMASCAAACRDTPDDTTPIVSSAPVSSADETLQLPKKLGSIRFAAIGDAGRGDRYQYDVSAQLQKFHDELEFPFVVMLGDNIYGEHTPDDFRRKFELPYKPLIDEGVKFFAVLGNHDDISEMSYAPFNMGGVPYYTFERRPPLLGDLAGTSAQFFMIDSERLNRTQLAWLDRELGKSEATWKIPVLHRPLYTSGRYSAPARFYRAALEPIFVKHGVRLALSGHEHFYQRTPPQKGITYFISGAAGSLRVNDMRQTPLTARGFDEDYSFMLFEIAGKTLHFQAISRTGRSIDIGTIEQ
jgi:hypothetical protein